MERRVRVCLSVMGCLCEWSCYFFRGMHFATARVLGVALVHFSIRLLFSSCLLFDYLCTVCSKCLNLMYTILPSFVRRLVRCCANKPKFTMMRYKCMAFAFNIFHQSQTLLCAIQSFIHFKEKQKKEQKNELRSLEMPAQGSAGWKHVWDYIIWIFVLVNRACK